MLCAADSRTAAASAAVERSVLTLVRFSPAKMAATKSITTEALIKVFGVGAKWSDSDSTSDLFKQSGGQNAIQIFFHSDFSCLRAPGFARITTVWASSIEAEPNANAGKRI